MPAVADLPAPLVETGTQFRFKEGARFNIAAGTKTFECKFLEPGFVSYRDCGGKMELLRKEAIESCMESVIGIPVTIGHIEVTATNRADVEHGVVKAWHYNADDGWFYVTGEIDSHDAQEKIRSGWRPSCGFQVGPLGPGGVDHGIRFDQEITSLKFNHLAIVERPRYDGAAFRLNSYIVSNTMNIAKLVKKIVTRITGADGQPAETTQVVSRDVALDTEVTLADGSKARLNELFDAYSSQNPETLSAAPEDTFELGGKTVTMAQLADAYVKAKARANATAAATETLEQKTARELREKETKTQRDNAAAAEVLERENGRKAFAILEAARTDNKPAGVSTTSSGSLKERVALGAKKY